MSIELHDGREYAWLLVRADTITSHLVRAWQSVPIRPGSKLLAVVGYPMRFIVLAVSVLYTGATILIVFILAALVPVTIFAFVHRILPDVVWLVALAVTGAAMAGYLAYAVGQSLQKASRSELPVQEGTIDSRGEWDPWQSIQGGHESSRSGLFAGVSICIGVIVQCAAVVLGPHYFEGSVESTWAWTVLFGEQLFDTMLLGIPGTILPAYASIQAASFQGRLLTVGVDIFFVAGVITMIVLVLPSGFRTRELFNGTVRDLADYLENFDISGGKRMTINRVAVLRPLDEREVVSLSKEEFFTLVRAPDAAVEPPVSASDTS